MVDLQVWDSLDALFSACPEAGRDLWLATTKAPRDYSQVRFSPDCWLFLRQGDRGTERAPSASPTGTGASAFPCMKTPEA